ncbi:hypothetical protein BJ742DRAFT_766697 [Cladochytrium replicatum]|nr:hypothetical protein BJ742DRAFT_766697 [Cladochytrium replicatum]
MDSATPTSTNINAKLSWDALQEKLPKSLQAERIGVSALSAWVSSAAFASGIIPSLRTLPGWPHFLVTVAYSGIFAGSGYMITQDEDNGPSTATAWGISYLSLFAHSAVKSRRFGPIALTASVIASTAIYGREWVDGFF